MFIELTFSAEDRPDIKQGFGVKLLEFCTYQQYYDSGGKHSATEIYCPFDGEGGTWRVKETPEQIMQMIEDAKKVNQIDYKGIEVELKQLLWNAEVKLNEMANSFGEAMLVIRSK
jgi:hypothetical protein